MSVSNFTVYIYRDAAMCDGLSNQESARRVRREVGVADHRESPSETRMGMSGVCVRHNAETSEAASDSTTAPDNNNASILHRPSMTNRFVRCPRRKKTASLEINL